MSATIAFEFDY